MPAACLLATTLNTALVEPSFGSFSHNWFVPLMIRQSSPDLAPDHFINRLSATTPTFFWRGLGLLVGGADPEPLLLVLRFVAVWATFMALWVLARSLWLGASLPPDGARLFASIAVLAALPPRSYLNLLAGPFEHGMAAWPLLLLALAWGFQGRGTSLGLAGLAMGLHIQYSVFVSLGLLAQRGEVWLRARQLGRSLGLALLCGLPALLLVAIQSRSRVSLSPAEAADWFDLIRTRHNSHLFVSTWATAAHWGGLLTLPAAVTLLSRLRGMRPVGVDRMLLVFALVFVVGALGTEWQWSVDLARAQPIRIAVLMRFLAGLGVLAVAIHHWSGDRRPARVGSVLLIAGIVSGDPWVLVSTGVLLHAVAAGWPQAWDRLLAAGAVLAVVLLALGGKLAHAPIVSLAGGAVAALAVATPLTARRPRAGLLAGLLLAVGLLSGLAVLQRTRPHDRDWVDAQHWVRNHTRTDETVLIPSYLYGFRIHSRRSVVVEHEDSQVGFVDPGALLEWQRRAVALGYGDTLETWRRQFHTLDWATLRRLAVRYGASVLVTDQVPPDAPPPLYRNVSYSVYRFTS
jgi:hypothetical protein